MPFEYLATLRRPVDGDTIDVELDQGFGDFKRCRLRLRGINAPELHDKATPGSNRTPGSASLDELAALLATAGPNGLRIVTRRTSKNNTADQADVYGRYVADVFLVNSGLHVNAWMVEQGLAVPFMTD